MVFPCGYTAGATLRLSGVESEAEKYRQNSIKIILA
jgi:hypothetical protein